jgi:hypothetical protein
MEDRKVQKSSIYLSNVKSTTYMYKAGSCTSYVDKTIGKGYLLSIRDKLPQRRGRDGSRGNDHECQRHAMAIFRSTNTLELDPVVYLRALSCLDFARVKVRTNNLAREPRDQWVC